MRIGGGWVILGILAIGLGLPVLCQAAVKGDCSACHTMHNSQEGVPVAFSFSSGEKITSAQPFASLLKTDCLGCHSDAGSETIIQLGGSRVPIVFNLAEPTYPPDGSNTSSLAGGNFHWLVSKGDAYGHNVYGIASADLRYPPTQAPGGVERIGECANCHGSLATAESGCQGCHVAQHHIDNDGIEVVDKGLGWYRFLGSVMQRTGDHQPTAEGVVGIEDPNWEQSPSANQHNTYQGKAGPYTSYLESGAIDQKCVGCHSQFHNETLYNSTWIRHPSDVVIPDSGEYTAFTTYNPLVPVAKQNVSLQDANFSDISRGSDMVSCISCHRAHGSPYPAMLRWGYRDWPGNDSHTTQPAFNGCAVCHTAKD